MCVCVRVVGESKVLFPINGRITFLFYVLLWGFGSVAPTCGCHLLCVSDFVDKQQKSGIAAALNACHWTRALTGSGGWVCGWVGVPVPLFTQRAQDTATDDTAWLCARRQGSRCTATQDENASSSHFLVLVVGPLVAGGPQGWECSWSR